MKVISTIQEIQYHIRSLHDISKLGFIPTMGYLHQGHLSLIESSKRTCDYSVVSIFVNPAQFGPNEDYNSYPRDMSKDLNMLESIGVDVVFTPTLQDMYPAHYRTYTEVSGLSEVLCGASRPGHFRGVATIVQKLVNIVKPTHMFMGLKDYQQVVVLETMLRDLNMSCKIVRCPIVRERDGLALSSRNNYLSEEERQRAICLHQAIMRTKQAYHAGETDCNKLINIAEKIITQQNGQIDYIQIVSPHDLLSIAIATDDSRIMLAVKIGKTRLIDNDCLCC